MPNLKSIPSQQQRQLESVRERNLRQTERNTAQGEVMLAKQIQRQTGCTWTEALRASYRKGV